MPSVARLAPLALALGAVLAPGLAGAAPGVPGVPGIDGAPMTILYDTQDAVRAVTQGPAGLGPERGAFRQDPGPGGLLLGDGRDAERRVGKVGAGELVGLTAEGMAARLRQEIDTPRFGSTSHLVAIDEIGNRFNDGRATVRYETQVVRGKQIRVATHNRLVVTETGYRVERGPAPMPAVDPDSPGARLSQALRLLAVPSPHGGTYAERVHLYIAPAFSSSIAAGRGPHRHLGRDGKPHRATWRGVMPAVGLAGGVWIEMYHHSSGRGAYPFTAAEWSSVPSAFGAYHRRFGGDRERLHLVFTGADARPKGAARACGAPMPCQWRLARGTAAGRALLANGPGAYRLGAQARSWLAELNRGTR